MSRQEAWFRSVRARLRDATRDAHAQAEAVHWRSTGFESRSRYFNYLSAVGYAHWTLGLEAAERRDDRGEVAFHHNAIEMISKDLSTDVSGLPLGPQDRSVSWSWGVSYALVGSSIGAAHILRSPNFVSQWSTRYLCHADGYLRSGSVGRFFRDLEHATPDFSEALSGAMDTFILIAGASTETVAEDDTKLGGVLGHG